MMKYGCSASFDAQFASVSSSTSQERPRQANMSLWPAAASAGRRSSKGDGCMVVYCVLLLLYRLRFACVLRLRFDAALARVLFVKLSDVISQCNCSRLEAFTNG